MMKEKNITTKKASCTLVAGVFIATTVVEGSLLPGVEEYLYSQSHTEQQIPASESNMHIGSWAGATNSTSGAIYTLPSSDWDLESS